MALVSAHGYRHGRVLALDVGEAAAVTSHVEGRFRVVALWVDGVGTYLLCENRIMYVFCGPRCGVILQHLHQKQPGFRVPLICSDAALQQRQSLP